MADSEKYYFARALQDFDKQGRVEVLEPDVAARMVRYLRAGGHTAIGSVASLDTSITEAAALRRHEIERMSSGGDDVIAGPYVIGVTDDSDGFYDPNGVMLYQRYTA